MKEKGVSNSELSSLSKNPHLFRESINALNDPFFFEDLARKDGYDLIAGVDEAGRGPLAGPVVAAAVIVPKNSGLAGIRDSKKMSAKAREEGFSLIQRTALATGIGVVSHKYIDEFNILKASLEAMKRAILRLGPKPEFLLVDGIHAVPITIPQRCIKKGDQLSKSISAASVLAKVYRDRIMRSYHKMYPVYGFDKHKGYGTPRHLEALKQYGASPFHRMSFKGVS
ncbi:MAG: ribonuclease HII [Desulfobacterales bacterium]|nr:ribonuclease HII [Desulfobacterales bacterium]